MTKVSTQDHRVSTGCRRRARTRATLLRAGLQVMAKKGPGQTSIDDVIRAAGVARGTFYKYFRSIPDLINALGPAVLDEIVMGQADWVGQLADPAERICAGLTSVIALVESHPVLGHFMARSGWPAADLSAHLMQKIGGVVDQGMDEGRFAPMPRSVALALIEGVVLGSVHAVAQGASARPIGISASEVILRGFGLPAEEVARIAGAPVTGPAPRQGYLLGGLASD
ncbi:TetR/AcrR family transcriptional regulator [Mesobaculum littorinae]|nr:TetR/AcrR family transcriptional regulator [Mesobaculum littorinae]